MNPLFYSEVASDDRSLAFAVYDNVSKTFFSTSPNADVKMLAEHLQSNALNFRSANRFIPLPIPTNARSR